MQDQDLKIAEISTNFFNEDSQSKQVISYIQDVYKYSSIKNIGFIRFELFGLDFIKHLIVQANQIKMQVDWVIISQNIERQIVKNIKISKYLKYLFI